MSLFVLHDPRLSPWVSSINAEVLFSATVRISDGLTAVWLSGYQPVRITVLPATQALVCMVGIKVVLIWKRVSAIDRHTDDCVHMQFVHMQRVL